MIIIIMVTSTSLLEFSSINDYYQSYLFAELKLKYWTLLDFSRKIFPNILVQSRDVIFLKDLHNIFLKLQKNEDLLRNVLIIKKTFELIE